MKEYNLEGFERGLFELGITLSEKQKTQFLQYYELLVEWNSFMNLTANHEIKLLPVILLACEILGSSVNSRDLRKAKLSDHLI